MRAAACILLAVLSATPALAAPKSHGITFGKWTPVKWFVGPDENKAFDLRVRALYVDGRAKEFTLGAPHDITDRLFVVRRAFRLNDSLPEETVPDWRWERGGWLLVDRVSGHISPLTLTEFDPYHSAASWYRDYIAYCGVSDDGQKLFAIVSQLDRRKPILKQSLGDATVGDLPDSACPAPVWQRQPISITFHTEKGQKQTYTIRGHAADAINDDDEEDRK